LTLTQPPAVAAATGMDALAHAVETAVTKKRTALAQMYSREAFRLCSRGLRRVLAEPKDVSARGEVLLGAALAGLAIEYSMLGAAHAAANPLTARFGVVHGQAVGLMLPVVIRFNAEEADARALYGDLALAAGLPGARPDCGAEALVEFLDTFRKQARLPRSLAALAIGPADLPALAEDAAGQWTAGFNPRRVTAGDFLELYQSVLAIGQPKPETIGVEP
jgi:alcohol dehydrogenase